MDRSMQEALLSDHRVAAAVKNAGQDALKDPAVQQKIFDVCREKFPEYAVAARDHILAWARDPVLQARAKQSASYAADFVLDQLEHGPAGVRMLAAVGALASVANSVLSVVNVVGLISHVLVYLISVYQLIFGLTSLVFELPPTWVQKVEETTTIPVSQYQDLLMENAKFLCQVGGRGLFYIFQGSLWLAFASFTSLLDLSIGLYLIFVGAMHVAMHFGVLPQTVSEKLRQGYRSMASGP